MADKQVFVVSKQTSYTGFHFFLLARFTLEQIPVLRNFSNVRPFFHPRT